MDTGLDWFFVSSDTNKNTNRFSPPDLFRPGGAPLRLNWSDCKFLVDLHFYDLWHEAASRLFEVGLNVMEVGSKRGTKCFRRRSGTHIYGPKNLP
jgi:hypothetical protein